MRPTRLLSFTFAMIVFTFGWAQQIPADATAAEVHRAAISAINAKQYPQAVALFKRVTELEPRHKFAWNNLGRAYRLLDRNEEAVAAFKRQIEIDPFDEYSYNNMGLALLDLGKKEEAEAAFRKQIEVNPLDKWAHKNLGKLLLETRRFKEAIESFETASRITPDDQSLRIMTIAAYQNSGDHEKSQALIKEMRGSAALSNAIIPSDPLLKKLRGVTDAEAALTQGRANAAEMISRLAKMEPRAPKAVDKGNTQQLFEAWAQIGMAYLLKDELAAAQKYLHVAWFWTQSGIVADRLAQAYEKGGKMDEAIEFYQRAVQAQPPYPDSQFALAKLVGGIDKADQMIQANRVKYMTMKGKPLKFSAGRLATATYTVVVEGEKVIAVNFEGGDNSAMNLEKILAEAGLETEFPDDQRPRLVRTTMVFCTESNCSYMTHAPAEMAGMMQRVVSTPSKQ